MAKSNIRTHRGTISELVAAADLTEKGYEVFRALDPCASCDLLTLKDGKTQRVQVRTIHPYIKKDGSVTLNKFKSPDDAGRTDVYAFVIGHEVIYEKC